MKTVILAAGKGSRLHSELTHVPKVLRQACGRPLLSYVLSAIPPHADEDVVLVVGFEKEKVMEAFPQYHHAVQENQLGTGHAVFCTKNILGGYDGDILIMCGDTPLVRRESIDALLAYHKDNQNKCTLLSCNLPYDASLGRIMRDSEGHFTEIVENAECTDEQKKVHEYNAGIYVMDAKLLFPALDVIMETSTKKEIYLTDVPELLLKQGHRVEAIPCKFPYEIYGVNTEEDLALAEKTLKEENLI